MTVFRVGILVFDQARSYDVVTATEIFADRSAHGLPAMHVEFCSGAPRESVRLDTGLEIAPVHHSRAYDLLVVPGSEQLLGRLPEADLALIARGTRQTKAVAGLCTGAFALAEAGVLNGGQATTHWRYTDLLAQRYRQITVQSSQIYVASGGFWTSAGVSAGADLLLHLVDEFHGRSVAAHIAKSMVLPLHRAGNQSQFVDHTLAGHKASPLSELAERVRHDPRRDWSVRALARALAVSERSCHRLFHAQLGCTPAAWIQRERLEVARQLLETTDLAVGRVAEQSGVGSAENLRKLFAARFGISPTDYRRRFGGQVSRVAPA
ncbi:helix-turn-helix domain-containing protein [Glutamicibacter endophyticus]